MNNLETINNLTVELAKTEENYCRTEKELFEVQKLKTETTDLKLMKIFYREKYRAIDKKYKELNNVRKELRNLDKKLAETMEDCNVVIKTEAGFVMKYDPADKNFVPIYFLPNELIGSIRTEHEHDPIAVMERIGIDYPIDFEEHLYCSECWKCLDGDPRQDQDAVDIEIDENNIPC